MFTYLLVLFPVVQLLIREHFSVMDPLEEVHEHVHELIFQHLTVEDVLMVSLVSKKWCKVVGKSTSAMKKVWLNVGDRFNEPKKDDLKAFRASERDYQNFKMSEIENGLQILLFPKRQWRRAQIDIQSFINFRDFVNLLYIVCDTIVELEIFDMDIEDVNYDNGVQCFSLLEKLRIGFVTSVALKPFLMKQPLLNKLILEDISDLGVAKGENVQDLIVKLLTFQPQLTCLSLSSDAFCKAFKYDNSFNFQLKHLLVEYQGNCETTESKIVLKSLEVFLSTQKNLKWITLCEWTSTDIIDSIFNRSKVERISFDYFDVDSKKFDSSLLKLHQNLNIKQMDFDCENIDLCWLKPLLEATPAVNILYFFHISQELLLHVLTIFKHLKLLKYCSIFENFDEFYCNLKQQPDNNNTNCNVEIVEEKFIDLKRMI